MNEICIPLSAVAVAGEDDMTPPDVGDDVSFTVDGKITRVDNSNAYVEITKANGEDMPAMSDGMDGDTDDQELEALAFKRMAEES